MTPRRRWGILLTLLALTGALVLSEHGRSPGTDIVGEVPQKARAPEPDRPARAAAPAAGPVTLALRPSTEITGSVEQKPAEKERDKPASRASAETSAGPMILALRPRTSATRISNSFTPHDWTPPPPPQAKPPPPPPPTAPPVPYSVLGKKFEDGTWQVFLARQDQVFVVKPQDTIENTYRVEETKPPVMTLTYLPLQQRQTLSIGAVE